MYHRRSKLIQDQPVLDQANYKLKQYKWNKTRYWRSKN